MKDRPYLCTAPWTHTYVSPQGERRLCCASREEASFQKQYLDSGTAKGKFEPQSLKEHWNSDYMKDIRKRMLAGEAIPQCAVCNDNILNLHTYRKYFTETLFPHKIAVWGNVQKNYLTETRNISKDRIIACGSPRHDNFFNDSINNNSSENDTILLCPRPIVEVAGHYSTNAFVNYELVLKKVIHQLQQIKHANIIVKLHPGDIDHNNLIKKAIQKIDPQILISNTKPIHELINNSKLVLVISPDGFDPSTVILESIILKRPVINLVLDNKFYDFSYEKHNAVISLSSVNNLNEEIQRILNNSTFRNEIIENGKNFLNDYLNNHKNAAKSLANELLKLENRINHL